MPSEDEMFGFKQPKPDTGIAPEGIDFDFSHEELKKLLSKGVIHGEWYPLPFANPTSQEFLTAAMLGTIPGHEVKNGNAK